MSTAIQTNNTAGNAELALIAGDLSKLTAEQRLEYYRQVCASTGLNVWTKPFDYIMLNGKLTLYCRKDATDQLRKIHNVSVTISSRERIDDVYVVTARASLPDGRSDESIGAVTIGTLKGDGLANALMKAETKAKRRATLSICGLGWLDESETNTIPDAQRVQVDDDTGRIVSTTPIDIASRRITNPPTPRVLTQDAAAAERKRLWTTLNEVVLEGKALGLDVQTWEQMQMDGVAPNDVIIAAGRELRQCITARKQEVRDELEAEQEDERGSFTEVDDAELWPNGRPA